MRLMGLEITAPDHSTLSRRGRGFAGRQPRAARHDRPVHVVLDSTGLQVFGQGEWDAEKHGRKPRRWRKLHLAVDAETGEIVAYVLTDKDGGDISQVPSLLATVEGPIASVTADGAYDGEVVYQEAAARQHDPPIDVVIPPRSSSVAATDSDGQTVRDRHVRLIAENGRMAWQKATDYGRRSLVETAIGRHKHIIGSALRARSDDGQGGEAAIAVQVLNRMDPHCQANLRSPHLTGPVGRVSRLIARSVQQRQFPAQLPLSAATVDLA